MPESYRRPTCKACDKARWSQKKRKRYPVDRRTSAGRKIWLEHVRQMREGRSVCLNNI